MKLEKRLFLYILPLLALLDNLTTLFGMSLPGKDGYIPCEANPRFVPILSLMLSSPVLAILLTILKVLIITLYVWFALYAEERVKMLSLKHPALGVISHVIDFSLIAVFLMFLRLVANNFFILLFFLF